ncbi:MAG TPA: 3'-5' exonuclease [Saprospiraceae bacterium]|nr:3'-5' exonuclease [Saprospiraceae bacterium]HQW54648.1 3'-5' exonuclease [Saprospiraceae bacterium]
MNYVIYDLEAACWLGRPPAGHNEIIEIGAFCINGYGEITNRFARYVRPVINPKLSGFCKSLTSIQQHNVDTADRFDIVIDDFLDWFDYENEEYYLISWGENDRKLLTEDCLYHDRQIDWLKHCVDLKDNYQSLRHLDRPLGLKKALIKEDIEFEGKQHRAIDDALNLAQLFLKHFDRWEL